MTRWYIPALTIAATFLMSDSARSQERRRDPQERFKRMDSDGDGKVSKDEFMGPERFFERLDADGDGVLTAKEMESMRGMRRGRGMGRDDGAPKVGQVAPTFKLNSLDGKTGFDLASFKGHKPVILLFGSYT